MKIILTLLFIHYIGFFFNKRKNNILSCGIFGWAGKNPTKFNKDKLNMLGLANETRGRHSCGVAVDGDIQVGIDNYKLFTEFALDNRYKNPSKIPVVIGHTRMATYGAHTLENAHPFGFGEHKGGFKFIGCHNGTLINHVALAEKYKINLTSTSYEGKKEITRTKIDSEILLEIIYKTGNITVLNEYEGAAALVWSDLSKPNILYCYHGKSKVSPHEKEASEERPLYYYQESKNSGYFSSIYDSLKMISNGQVNNIHDIKHNIVYQIVDGDFKSAKKFKVDRKGRYQKRVTTNNYMGSSKKYGEAYDNSINKKKSATLNVNKPASYKENANIFFEKPRFTAKEIGGRPYFNKLAWWRNGHRITGCYINIKNYGLYSLNVHESNNASLKDQLHAELKNSINRSFSKKIGYFIKNDISNIEFKDINSIPVVYIYKGIMLKTFRDYDMAIQMNKLDTPFNFIQLSHCSVHPLTVDTVKNHDLKQNIILNGELYNGLYSSSLTHRMYNFEDGNLFSYTDIKTPDEFYYNSKKEIKIEQLKLPLSTTAPIRKIDPVLVLDTIDQIFEKPVMQLLLGKTQLEKYLPDSTAKDAIDTIDIITDYIKDLT